MQMRLLVRVDDQDQDIEVSVEADHHTDDLIRCLAEAAALGDAATFVVERTGRPLNAVTTAGQLDLRPGDRIITGRRRAKAQQAVGPADAPGRLVVSGGEGAGAGVPLGADLVVGRGPKVGLRLSDALISREHCRVVADPAGVTVEDLGSANGTFIDGSPVTAPQPLGTGQLIEVGRSLLRVAIGTSPTVAGKLGPVAVHRPPRTRASTAHVELDLRLPDAPRDSPRLPLATSLLPLLAAGVLAIFFGPRMLAFAALSPVMAVGTYLEDRRGRSKSDGRTVARFTEQLAQAVRTIDAAVVAETRQRRALHPDLAELADRCRSLTPPLWQTRPGDPDFLAVRLGSADVPARTSCALDGPEESSHRRAADEALRLPRILPSVPVTADLVELGVAGVAGRRDFVVAAAAAVILDIAARHSPEEVGLAVCSTDLPWAHWLPHATPSWWPADLRAGPADLLQSIADTVMSRQEASKTSTGAAPPRLVVIADETARLPASAVATVLRDGPAVGVFTIWLGTAAQRLPGECAAILDVSDADKPTVGFPKRGEAIDSVVPDLADPDVVAEAARQLAGAVDATAAGGAATIPTQAPLPSLLDLAEIDADAVQRRWAVAEPGVVAPIGVGAGGVTTSIDIRGDGPHALIGGTTGAGKSELLQSLVASLAVSYPPERVTFVLVDYKGGAAFKDCVELPHVVGFVTDLDGGLVQRALVSLNAELRRREHLLRDAGCRDIVEMESRHLEKAPPVLLLVVDEFAALARELPAFVEGVVDVAQRGRSLGIHLVLATQRPTGVINDNIRANTNLRIALRMNDRTDSDDVLGKPDAASLPRSLPGRAFIRTGESELALVQVAYAGGVTDAAGAGKPRVLGGTVKPVARPSGRSDLQRLVAAVDDAFIASGRPAPRPPWLPALPTALALDELTAPDSPTATPIGLVDLPAEQRQDVVGVDLATCGGVLVLGGGASGKSTLLRTLATGLAGRLTPEQFRLYGVDFGSGGLAVLQTLPHCAAIVPGSDQERTSKVFAVVDRAIAQRTVDGFDPTTQPRLLLLLDGYSAFAAAYEKVDLGALIERLPRLAADGRSVGVTVALTADRRGAMPVALYAALETRFVMRMSDADDYVQAGLDAMKMRGVVLPAGRAVLPDATHVQVAQADTAAVAAAMADLAPVAPLGVLPAHASLDEHISRAQPLRPVMAVEELEIAPVDLPVDEGHVLVAGPPRTGRSTTLVTTASALRQASPELALYLLAPRRSPLSALDVWTAAAAGRDACEDLAGRLEDLLAGRTETSDPIVIVVDDAEELRDTSTDSALETLARRGRDLGVRLVIAADNAQAHRAYSGCIPEVRRDRTAVLLSPNLDLDGDLVGVRLPRRQLRWPVGRAYLVTGGAASLVQVLTAEVPKPSRRR